MSTGPEHYAEAERLLEAARADFRAVADPSQDVAPKAYAMAYERATVAINAAQVHATLALAAATGVDVSRAGYPGAGPILREWRDVAARRPAEVA